MSLGINFLRSLFEFTVHSFTDPRISLRGFLLKQLYQTTYIFTILFNDYKKILKDNMINKNQLNINTMHRNLVYIVTKKSTGSGTDMKVFGAHLSI